MIVYFRAVAILLIVAGHSHKLAGIRLDGVFDRTVSDLIAGSTALFVFISGFLFDYIYSARYSYRSFLLDRFKKIVIPYSVLTLIAGLIFSNWAAGGLSVGQLFHNFFFGQAFYFYWYIPFILLMFTLAPLHRLFIDLKVSHQIAIIVATLILAGLVQRPTHNVNAVQSVVFYMPIYLAGLFLSLHRETLLPVVQKNWLLLLFSAILLAVIQALGGQSNNLHKPFFVIHGFELMGLQKLALSLALTGLFARFPSPPGRIVSIIADTSFSIFFLHPFVLKLTEGTAFFHVTSLLWLNIAIAATAIVSLCVVTALALRACLTANSKYLTGY